MLATLLTLAMNAAPCEARTDEASAVTCGELFGQATRLVAQGPIGTVQAPRRIDEVTARRVVLTSLRTTNRRE
ncbi:MAG: hypothetical protein SFW67_03340 [Myxococcaceae bacterium]|nr:hypothetical protein [Myxococcaceae bacterium]